MSSSLGPALYSKLPPGYIWRSTVSIFLGGNIGFIGYQLFSGNERFYRNWTMPIMHKLFDAETAHRVGVVLARHGLSLGFSECLKEYPELKCTLFGRPLNNPIGLAAGFDKNGEAIEGLRNNSGFGFVEIGTVTPRPQAGNDRPRVFRLLEDQAVINSYGFNSDGVGAVSARVIKAFDPSSSVLFGVNLGKNKTTVDAVYDYEIGVNYFAPYCDYLVINISSPNTPGLRSLQSKGEMKKLLNVVNAALRKTTKDSSTKIVIKISPDLTREELKDIARLCLDRNVEVDALIISNTTIQRPESLKSPEAKRTGGLSGTPLRDLSTDCISEMFRLTGGSVSIIGCGGISSGKDAYEKILAGASAVQLYTALVYQGFPLVGRVKRELAELLIKDGYSCIEDAVGAGQNWHKRPIL